MPLHLQELGHLISFCELKIEYVVESIVFTSKFGMKFRILSKFGEMSGLDQKPIK